MGYIVEGIMNARIGELQRALEDLIIHTRDFVNFGSACAHAAGCCKCEIIVSLEKAEKVLE